MNILIAPDKFKGSLTSPEVCSSLAAGLKDARPDVLINPIPLADGGDGFASTMKNHRQTVTIVCAGEDPLGRPLQAGYEWHAPSATAIVELAQTSGLVLLRPGERNPLLTSTFGTGLVIRAAIEHGAQTILLGLGGSATNDGGMGILNALGFDILDASHKKLQPTGASLTKVAHIIPCKNLPEVRFVIACDVTNPLYGERGAAAVYAPQKGAGPASVRLLDDGLQKLSSVLTKQSGNDNAQIPGTGAAGGIAAGLMAFFQVTLQPGIEIVAAAAGLETEMAHADFILTGEGKLDAQSSSGKVVSYVTRLAAQLKKPVIVFAGAVENEDSLRSELNYQQAFKIIDMAKDYNDSVANAAVYLRKAGYNWLHRM